MNKLVVFLTLITVLSGCQNPIGSETALVNGQMKPIDTMQAEALIETNVSEPPQIEYPEFSISRTDFMLMSYISFSENEMIKTIFMKNGCLTAYLKLIPPNTWYTRSGTMLPMKAARTSVSRPLNGFASILPKGYCMNMISPMNVSINGPMKITGSYSTPYMNCRPKPLPW